MRGIRFEGQQLLFLTNLFGENCMEKLAADTNWSHKYTCQDTSSDRHRVCRNKSLVYMCWELKNNLFAEQEKDGEQSSRAHGKDPNPGAGGSCLEQECASSVCNALQGLKQLFLCFWIQFCCVVRI